MNPELLTLLKRSALAMDNIGAREHSHDRNCVLRYYVEGTCTCQLEEQEEELAKVLEELNKVIQENS
jgi:hypothetical protein